MLLALAWVRFLVILTPDGELRKIKKVFNNSFVKAVELILNCKGKVVLGGIGKSGLVARKISATFSSVGIPSFFCDPAQALHGDMGQIEKKDIFCRCRNGRKRKCKKMGRKYFLIKYS